MLSLFLANTPKRKHQLRNVFYFHTRGAVDVQIISNDISELQKNQATTVAKIVQYKRKLMDLSHRVLQVCELMPSPDFLRV